MKRISTSLAAGTVLAALAMAQPPRYTVTDLGANSGAVGINNAGAVGGFFYDASGIQHAALWVGGRLIDAGTPGLNTGASGPNASDALAIIADTPATDPLNENFCHDGTGLICIGIIWKNGVSTPLPTLGGNNAAAIFVNNRGQVAGFAETALPDSTCVAPQKLRTEAVVWGPGAGRIQQLPPLAGDTVGFALSINDAGQVVGSSGTCANTPLLPMPFGPHALLWQGNSPPTNLGTFGGTFNTGAAINNRGEVVGGSQLTGDIALHTFLWTKMTGMQDLHTIDGDNSSFPGAINNLEQVVGGSCDQTLTVCRAYLWQSGAGMVDLNSLIPSDSPLYLLIGFGINDVGEIAGLAVDDSGNAHAFLATPIPGSIAAQHVPFPKAPRSLPQHARKLLRWPGQIPRK